MVRISVIGLGYLGLTHAIAMAELGHTVVGIEPDRRKLDLIRQGVIPFFEPGLPEAFERVRDSGRLHFAVDHDEAGEWSTEADLHFICVGTPQTEGDYRADTGYVEAAARAVAPVLKEGAVVVGKSTVPVGTAERVLGLLRDGAAEGVTARLVWNPEFLREGHALNDSLYPDRIVVGASDDHAVAQMRLVYAAMLERDTPFLQVDLPTAELVKVAANSFLATKISFINAMAEVAEVAGADVTRLAEAIGLDDRIGPKFLRAGVGFGGGCLPKDIRGFIARAEELGVGESVAFLREVDAINLRRRDRVVELVRESAGDDLAGFRVAVLGAAFKPDSDDVRDSPALAVAQSLHAAGAAVTVHDPEATGNARRVAPELGYADDAEQALRGAQAVLLLTEWQEYRAADPERWVTLVDSPTMIDGRNVLDPQRWKAAGWHLRALGRSL